MRIWSLHPSLLDDKELKTLWKEGIKAVKAFRKLYHGERPKQVEHPQLRRFRRSGGFTILREMLEQVYIEAQKRDIEVNHKPIEFKGYKYQLAKRALAVTSGQLSFEFGLLQSKLMTRAPQKFQDNEALTVIPCNPALIEIDGDVEVWEKTKVL